MQLSFWLGTTNHGTIIITATTHLLGCWIIDKFLSSHRVWPLFGIRGPMVHTGLLFLSQMSFKTAFDGPWPLYRSSFQCIRFSCWCFQMKNTSIHDYVWVWAVLWPTYNLCGDVYIDGRGWTLTRLMGQSCALTNITFRWKLDWWSGLRPDHIYWSELCSDQHTI